MSLFYAKIVKCKKSIPACHTATPCASNAMRQSTVKTIEEAFFSPSPSLHFFLLSGTLLVFLGLFFWHLEMGPKRTDVGWATGGGGGIEPLGASRLFRATGISGRPLPPNGRASL